MTIYKTVIKPVVDKLGSLIGLIILLPLILLISVILFFYNSGTPFFIQSRPGKNGVVFKLIKFKTMVEKICEYDEESSQMERITPIGKFLRRTSLDEIPQLINVLKGDMSLIGPRPLLVEYLQFYNDFQKRRHDVKPGITGWAQVKGRNAISWDEKFEFDIWYVDNISLKTDCKILWMTLIKLFNEEGINSSEYFTMEKFKGSNNS